MCVCYPVVVIVAVAIVVGLLCVFARCSALASFGSMFDCVECCMRVSRCCECDVVSRCVMRGRVMLRVVALVCDMCCTSLMVLLSRRLL